MELFWTPEAIRDRDNIFDYIEEDNPLAALALDDLLSVKAQMLQDHPESGRLGRIPGTKELVVHSNYMLVYEVVDGHVRVLAVVHTSKNWPPSN